MAKALMIGGVFLLARDPAALAEWYQRHLGWQLNRVDDVDAVVARLHEEGVETSPVTVGSDAEGTGKFARLLDPEGHRIELWQHLADGTSSHEEV